MVTLTRKRGITTQLQAAAEELHKLYPEESFSLFCGLIKRRGVQWAYETLSRARDYARTKKEKYPIQFLMVNKVNR